MKLEQSSEGQPSLPRTFKMAVWAGVENSVKIHIDRGDHLEARDDQGCTPLMLAASRKNQKICKLLIDAGACLFSVDKLGRTALDIALQFEATDVVRMLQEAASSSQKILSKSSNLIDELLVSNEHDHLLTDSSMYREIEFIDLEDVSNETSDWLPEEELNLSQKDTALYLSIQSTEKAISAFEPIDKSVGWSDLDVYLPAKASPLTREQDPEVSAELRLLLLRVMREGSVPFMSIEAISSKLADSDAFEFPSQVFRVIDELGGQVDERFEYDSDYETYKVYVDHIETEFETEQVSEALSYLEGVSSNQYEPLRMYFRDGNGCSLITADDEVFLGRKMQSGHEEIMSVVSQIPDLTLKICELGQSIKNGEIALGNAINGIGKNNNKKNEHKADEVDDGEQIEKIDEALFFFAELAAIQGSLDKLNQCKIKNQIEIESAQQSLTEHCQKLRLSDASLDLLEASFKELISDSGTLLQKSDLHYENLQKFEQIFKSSRMKISSAKHALAEANLRLVISIAQRYRRSGIPFEDLIQEGNLGLLKAVDRFDYELGYKFSTYATWWIRQAVGRSVAEDSRVVRLPVHAHESAQQLLKICENYESKKGRYPQLSYLAESTGLTVYKVNGYLRASLEPLSIVNLTDISEVDAEDASEYFIPDPCFQVSEKQIEERLGKLIGKLDSNQAKVIQLRFGLGGEDELTLNEVGTLLGFTRERARQIETQGLRNLRQLLELEQVGGSEPINPRFKKQSNNLIKNSRLNHRTSVGSSEEAGKSGANDFSAGSHLGKLLGKAKELGLDVVHELHDDRTHYLVKGDQLQNPSNQVRSLIRRLMTAGFEKIPGTGYWK